PGARIAQDPCGMQVSPDALPTLRRSSPPLPAGRILGDRYELRGVLGEGATGIVYEARRISEKDLVALKVIHPHLTGDEEIGGRFKREAAILGRLVGKHLCPVIDFGELSDSRGSSEATALLFMALPKVEGPSLENVLASDEAPLRISRALEIVLQICLALE